MLEISAESLGARALEQNLHLKEATAAAAAAKLAAYARTQGFAWRFDDTNRPKKPAARASNIQ